MNLKQGLDFYYDEKERMVLTASYLLKRGHCCQSGCKHCPYGYSDKVDPNIPVEFQDPWKLQKQDSGWTYNPDEDED